MKFHLQKIFFAVLLVLVPLCAEAGFLSGLERGGISSFHPPKADVRTLKNGMKCFILEDHSLPMAEFSIITKTGSIYDPGDKVGLAEITGMLMRSGGAGDLVPMDFDKAVDDLGAVLSSGIGQEMGDVGLTVLTEDIENGLNLMMDVIFKPRFDAERLKVAKLKILEMLKREEDNPGTLAARDFRQLVYGKTSPWARKPDAASLARITTEDARKLHEKYFKTDNMILAAAGDFDTEKLITMLESLLAGAPRGTPEFPAVEEVVLEFKPEVRQVTKPLTQSFIRMGHLGLKRHNPDKYALMLADDILGAGNFKSRLMEDIRTKRGMAYSIWSSMSMGTDYGLIVTGVDTKSTQAKEVVGLIREHIEKLAKDDDIKSDELEFARQSVLSSLVFQFDSASKVVGKLATFYFYGYPDNYWEIFRDKIATVGASQVSEAAHKYFHPDGLKIVVVGPKIEGL